MNGKTWTYTYNADGMRTKRVSGNTSYTYYYNGDMLRYLDYDSNTTDSSQAAKLYFVLDAAGNPIEVSYRPEGSTTTKFYYYVQNLQGDVIALVDSANGNTVVTYTYDAWGNVLSVGGSLATTLGAQNPFRYRGYVYDSETKLYYLQSRYYNPEMGRFINADAFASTGQGLLGNNMFAYCLNNPVLFSDSSGYVIELATDATEEQIEEYERAIAYLKTSKTAKTLIEKLDASSQVFTIVFVDNDAMQYFSISNTIYFDMDSGLTLADGASVQSAALGLAHKMGHAAQDLDGARFVLSEMNKLEEENLNKYEIPIATELGEPIRTDYFAPTKSMNTKNSTHFRTISTSSVP